jgi:hypothetical protein
MSEPEKHLPPEKLRELGETLRELRQRIRVTKLVATRSVKNRGGDHFIAYSAHFLSHQDDGAELVPEADEIAQFAAQGLTLEEARPARLMLSMEADIGALEAALANGSVSEAYFNDAMRSIRNGYNVRIAKVMGITHDD